MTGKPKYKDEELQHCYEMGKLYKKEGANAINCHFSLFKTDEHLKAWEEGKK